MNEKDEKQEKDEGGWDEKWRRDPVDAAMWAVIIIWVGILLLGSNLGWFDDMGIPTWSIGFFGAGAIMLCAIGFRLLCRPTGGRWEETWFLPSSPSASAWAKSWAGSSSGR